VAQRTIGFDNRILCSFSQLRYARQPHQIAIVNSGRLFSEVAVMLAVYLGMLFFASGQKAFYLDLYCVLRDYSSVEEKAT
jgi:hypothetical protein